jgi:hypothetical protein
MGRKAIEKSRGGAIAGHLTFPRFVDLSGVATRSVPKLVRSTHQRIPHMRSERLVIRTSSHT